MATSSQNVIPQASRDAAEHALDAMELRFPFSSQDMQLAAEVLNQKLGPDAYFCLAFETTHDRPTLPSAARKIFLFKEIESEVWGVVMLKPADNTAHTFDGLGQLPLMGLGNQHADRHKVLRRYAEQVLGTGRVHDLSVYSCLSTNATGLQSLTWAEWAARGHIAGGQYMKDTEFGRLWVPCAPPDHAERPCTSTSDGAVSWDEIWEGRFRRMVEGRAP